jgi:predicted ArsR family transcriptional regulator
MTDTFTTADLIAELQQYQQTCVPRRTTEKGEACGVTTVEFAAELGISETAARKRLKKLMAEGILESEWSIDGGSRMIVYYKVN